MYVLDFYFLEDPRENHLWVIGGLLVKYWFIIFIIIIIIIFNKF